MWRAPTTVRQDRLLPSRAAPAPRASTLQPPALSHHRPSAKVCIPSLPNCRHTIGIPSHIPRDPLAPPPLTPAAQIALLAAPTPTRPTPAAVPRVLCARAARRWSPPAAPRPMPYAKRASRGRPTPPRPTRPPARRAPPAPPEITPPRRARPLPTQSASLAQPAVLARRRPAPRSSSVQPIRTVWGVPPSQRRALCVWQANKCRPAAMPLKTPSVVSAQLVMPVRTPPVRSHVQIQWQ